MMKLRRGMLVALASAGVLLAACGDDDNNTPTPSGTEFTTAEKQALATAFQNTGLIPSDPQFSSLYSLLLGGVQRYGTITVPAAVRSPSGLRLAGLAGEYDATGLQYIFDITINNDPALGVQGLSAGLVAWSGLNTTTSTVDDWISIGANDDTATEFPETVSGVVPDDVSAEYYLASNETLYEGISGNASITAQSFGTSATDCTVTLPTVGTLNCTYRYGSMQGAFDFVAEPIFGSGTENVTFASTNYDLPAVRVTLSGNLTVPTGQVVALRSGLRKLLAAR
jgi:hypothetical protein